MTENPVYISEYLLKPTLLDFTAKKADDVVYLSVKLAFLSRCSIIFMQTTEISYPLIRLLVDKSVILSMKSVFL